MYSFIRKCLFMLDPEVSHTVALNMLNAAHRLKLLRVQTHTQKPLPMMGLQFPHSVGLAAGLDKNADYLDALGALGFGSIEIGTVTPKPQTGNPKPRLFRIPEHEAIINRMGFNSKGIDYVVKRLENSNYRGILGVNIGKNRDTSTENAIEDYLLGLQYLWKYASYVTINISSPNTQGLRDLQQQDALDALLEILITERDRIARLHQRRIPLVVKISPDMNESDIVELARVLLRHEVDGVIATNTTIQRPDVAALAVAQEAGGLSGRPLQHLSTETIRVLYRELGEAVPIIASGGVMDAASAREKISAGAKMVQAYTGFVYQGPQVLRFL